MKFVEFYDELSFKTNYMSTLNRYFENCKFDSIYQYKNFSTKRHYLNFINQTNDNLFDKTSKKIIERELIKLESLSSGLGDKFLEKIIEYNKRKNIKEVLDMWNENVEKFQLSHVDEFIEKNIQNKESKFLCKTILDNSPAGSTYFVQDSNMKDNVLSVSQKIMFNINFDSDMLCGKKWNRSESNILLIDGYIDSLGEIHHLLQLASENKNPYLVICKGLRDDVKSTIIHNAMRGTIDMMIVSLETNEENVNILNDISACCGADIVSALKGDTISNAVKEDLLLIKDVQIKENSLSFKLAENNSLDVQKKYLVSKKNSINESNPNFKYLTKRIKNLSNKRVDFYLRSDMSREIKVEIDYFLRFLINGSAGIVKSKEGEKLYTLRDVYTFKNIFKSTVTVLDSIGCCLLTEVNE